MYVRYRGHFGPDSPRYTELFARPPTTLILHDRVFKRFGGTLIRVILGTHRPIGSEGGFRC